MTPRISPTQAPTPSAPAPNMRNLALDWVDALGMLGSLYGLSFIFYLFKVEEVPRIVILAAVAGFPLARRRWMGKPVQTVSRGVSALGMLSTLLIAFGTLGGGGLAFALVVNARPAEPTPLTEPMLTVERVLPKDASAEQRAAFEAERQEQARQEAVFLERLHREERARIAVEHRERMVRLFLFSLVPVAMVALGGFLDRLRMRRDAAA